jgi:hypothetical protein
MPGRKTGRIPSRVDYGETSAAPMDGRGEGADRRGELRRWGEHIRGRAAARSGARAANNLATPGVEAGGHDARVRASPDRDCGPAEGSDEEELSIRASAACKAICSLLAPYCWRKNTQLRLTEPLFGVYFIHKHRAT